MGVATTPETETFAVTLRIGTAANFTADALIPRKGELTWTTDTHVLKIGDGVTAYASCVTIADVA